MRHLPTRLGGFFCADIPGDVLSLSCLCRARVWGHGCERSKGLYVFATYQHLMRAHVRAAGVSGPQFGL